MVQGKYFGLSYLRSEGETRVGVIVSNKVSKKAVERNRIKRLARAVIRLILPDINNIHLVVLTKKSADGIESDILKKDLKNLLDDYKKNSSSNY